MLKFNNINLTEKAQEYRNIVVLQSILILSALLLKDSFSMLGINEKDSQIIRDTFFLPVAFVYLLVIWHLLSSFTGRKNIFLCIILVILITMLFTVNPFFDFFKTIDSKRPFLFLIHFLIFLLESIVIYYAIFDIFSGRHISQEKLWGSASIFLMIGICFGSLYDVLNILDPGCMGEPLILGLESYTHCIAFSMTIIGGRDGYPNAFPFILKLSVVEAVISNLFVVLLVGRLLGKPEA